MQQFIQYLPFIEDILSIIGTLTVLATLLVRLPIFKRFENEVGAVTGYFLKVVRWLPTIGVNPRTKLLEKQLEELQPKTPSAE